MPNRHQASHTRCGIRTPADPEAGSARNFHLMFPSTTSLRAASGLRERGSAHPDTSWSTGTLQPPSELCPLSTAVVTWRSIFPARLTTTRTLRHFTRRPPALFLRPPRSNVLRAVPVKRRHRDLDRALDLRPVPIHPHLRFQLRVVLNRLCVPDDLQPRLV